MSVFIDGTNGITTPGLTDTANASVTGTLDVTGVSTLSTLAVTGATTLSSTQTLAVGTALIAPLAFQSGVTLTTPVAGTMNYNGVNFYATNDVTSGRGFVPAPQLFRLAANGTAIGAAIADYFGATSAITLAASGVYEIEFYLYFTKTTAGTVTFTLASSAAPVNLNANYVGTPVGGVGTVGAAQTAALVASTATAAALPATGSLTTGVNHQYVVRAIVESNASTFKLQVTESAGTVTPLRGSYYKVTRLSAGNVGTFV
jgi:hypothetical protein